MAIIMGILTVIQIVVEIVKLIMNRPKEQRAALRARLRAARLKANAGDTSELEKMWLDLSGRA